jgi:hypothetical protein
MDAANGRAKRSMIPVGPACGPQLECTQPGAGPAAERSVLSFTLVVSDATNFKLGS